ncbi:hypothetical protein PVAP13_3KG368527 [Panicum virgatum]|uniref:Uncharacterized protein n=1 Tax=Panicum virgatum TaxID=38727 RepID=A0A8T0UWD5_PANVG|nr:hypothetical protein PVAP13_3KG368527 [Panicum virgatum]
MGHPTRTTRPNPPEKNPTRPDPSYVAVVALLRAVDVVAPPQLPVGAEPASDQRRGTAGARSRSIGRMIGWIGGRKNVRRAPARTSRGHGHRCRTLDRGKEEREASASAHVERPRPQMPRPGADSDRTRDTSSRSGWRPPRRPARDPSTHTARARAPVSPLRSGGRCRRLVVRSLWRRGPRGEDLGGGGGGGGEWNGLGRTAGAGGSHVPAAAQGEGQPKGMSPCADTRRDRSSPGPRSPHVLAPLARACGRSSRSRSPLASHYRHPRARGAARCCARYPARTRAPAADVYAWTPYVCLGGALDTVTRRRPSY